jgi:hypothetical protein
LLKYPDAKIISLGIGDTTEPIPQVITSALAEVCITLVLVKLMYFSIFAFSTGESDYHFSIEVGTQ